MGRVERPILHCKADLLVGLFGGFPHRHDAPGRHDSTGRQMYPKAQGLILLLPITTSGRDRRAWRSYKGKRMKRTVAGVLLVALFLPTVSLSAGCDDDILRFLRGNLATDVGDNRDVAMVEDVRRSYRIAHDGGLVGVGSVRVGSECGCRGDVVESEPGLRRGDGVGSDRGDTDHHGLRRRGT